MTHSEKKFRKRIALTQPGNALFSLVAIHLIVFVLFAFLKLLWLLRYQEDPQVANYYFVKNALNWFTLPVDTGKLVKQPWSVFTHMFIHVNFWKVFANMLWLWSFGYIMRELTGNKKIVPIFIYGSLAGAAAFLISYNTIPSLHPFIADT
ncbi:MAG TPA: rhomboid family intramembrane serine protease, partial [Chitinophagaceae bacterium]|nr:rhomboid family intramembrane serine protease [Chitinophagaceae bacterium]